MRAYMLRMGNVGLAVAEAALAGLLDSCKIYWAILLFVKSKRIRTLATQCFQLNGAIFLTSVLFMNYVLHPLVSFIISDRGPADGVMETLFHVMFLVLWVFPIYVISFILNAVWYQDIADETFLHNRDGEKHTVAPDKATFQQRLVKVLSEELYRMLVAFMFLLQSLVCSGIPHIGVALYFVQATWLQSLYSFEYKWSLEGWPLEAKLTFFEFNWAYMAGFGLPAALVNWYFPMFVSSGIYALVFPIFIMMAILANPADNSPTARTAPRYLRLPVFRLSKWLTTMVLRVVCRKRR